PFPPRRQTPPRRDREAPAHHRQEPRAVDAVGHRVRVRGSRRRRRRAYQGGARLPVRRHRHRRARAAHRARNGVDRARRRRAVLLALTFLSVSLLALLFGTEPTSLARAISDPESLDRVILLNARLPRVALAATTGAELAAVGAALQALLRNPLAEPYTLGVSN